MKALEKVVGSTGNIVQFTKVNGQYLVGLANRSLAERLVREGLEIEGTLLKTFPFRRTSIRVTIGNLPFFVGDAAVMDALSRYGRITSIAPKQLRVGEFNFTDGRREAFILLHDGITVEMLPSRFELRIKGEPWPAFLTHGVKCSKCRGQGHRRANCPQLHGRPTTARRASPPPSTGLPPSTAPGLHGPSPAAPTPPAPTSPAVRLSGAQPDARVASPPSTAPRPSTPAPPASSVPVAAPVPPSVAPAPADPAGPRSAATEPTPPARPDFIAPCGPLPAQGTLGPATHTPDVDMTTTEEPSAPSPAAVSTPPLPAPQPAGPTPSAPHKEDPTPAMTPPSPPPTPMEKDLPPNSGDCIDRILTEIISSKIDVGPLVDDEISWTDAIDAILHPLSRAPFLARLSPILKKNYAVFFEAAIERARDSHPRILSGLSELRRALAPKTRRMSSSASPGSSGSAGQEPGRPSIPAPTGGRISSENGNQKNILKENSENRVYANPPAGVKDVNLAAARDVTLNLPAGTSSNGAARVSGNWADCIEDLSPGAEDDFNVVKTKKRRRESSNSPTAAAPSSNSGGARSSRRLHSSARSISKVNGHQLLGLANRDLAERLINNGLEVEGTLLRAFPFRKRAERITVGNLPFFVEDSAIIKALGPYGRITSIAPKMMKAGPYTYTDGRREAFIVLHEEVTTERLPTRLNITIKGEAWPAYLSSGIKCSRCHGQGHRRANCPLLAGRTTAPGPATPTSPTSVPPATAPRLPQQPSTQPPPPASPSPTMEVSDVLPTSRAALHPPAALRPSPPAPSALRAEDAPPAPPPVNPAPSLRTPGSREPAAPTTDVEMSIVEETFASSTSSAKNATRVDLDAFIEGHPSVSFAETDALGLGREEVLDLLSSRTKAQRKGPLLSPPQCDALVGLIGQILDLRPGAASNLYKVLGQVKAELRTTPAVPPTPTLPAPRPAEPTPPAPHGKMTTPAMATSPSPLFQVEEDLTSKRWDEAADIIYKLCNERYSGPLTDLGITEGDITDAVIYPEDREPLLRTCSTQKKNLITEIISAAIERARDSDPFEGDMERPCGQPPSVEEDIEGGRYGETMWPVEEDIEGGRYGKTMWPVEEDIEGGRYGETMWPVEEDIGGGIYGETMWPVEEDIEGGRYGET
ncbi:hypothetical protein LAZ67_1005797, partial [Cordylochernes scorpioides]